MYQPHPSNGFVASLSNATIKIAFFVSYIVRI